MKLRYHIDRANDGFLILETEPQVRNLFVRSENTIVNRLCLPYIYFAVRYIKLYIPEDQKACNTLHSELSDEDCIRRGITVPKGKPQHTFIRPGVFGNGLHVFCSLNSLSSFDDPIFNLPTDYYNEGSVCTNHSNDYSSHKSIESLVASTITDWWSHDHVIEYNPFSRSWKKVDLNQLAEGKWISPGSFREALMKPKMYANPIDLDLKPEAVLIEADWPCKLRFKNGKLSLLKGLINGSYGWNRKE